MEQEEKIPKTGNNERSNLAKRVLVGTAAGPLIFFGVIFSEYAFLAIAFVIMAGGLWEAYRIIQASNEISFTRIGWMYGLAVFFACVAGNFMNLYYLLFIGLFVFASGMITYRDGGGVNGAVLTYFWTTYIAAGIGSLVFIRAFPWSLSLNGDVPYAEGRIISLVFLAVWTLDTAAYFIGKNFGRRPFASRISPKKTLEGAVGGFLCTVAITAIAHYTYMDFFPIGHTLAIGLIIGILGQVGDLVMSAFKRKAHIKDSSSLIPGHGGVLDRFDSLYFSAPFIYFYTYFAF